MRVRSKLVMQYHQEWKQRTSQLVGEITIKNIFDRRGQSIHGWGWNVFNYQ